MKPWASKPFDQKCKLQTEYLVLLKGCSICNDGAVEHR